MKIPDLKSVPTRFSSWLAKRSFRPHKLRDTFAGAIFTIALCELSCYRILQSLTRSAEVPGYVPEMTILLMGVLETIVSPFLSWLGYLRRRRVLIILMSGLLLCLFTWFLLPDIKLHDDSEFCHASSNVVFGEVEESSAIRLGIIFCSCVMLLLTRVAIWNHGIAYLEEHGPDRISVHLGTLVFVRVMTLSVGHHMVGLVVKDSQIICYVIGLSINTLQVIFFMPSSLLKAQDKEKMPADDRNLVASICRVIANPLAMSLAVSLALLVAAVWGYGYYYTEIIKVKFLIYKRSDEKLFFTEFIQLFGIFMAVLYIGLRWSAPMQQAFDRLRAMQHALKMSIFVGIMFVVLTAAVSCEHGRVEGLEEDLYISPACSNECSCTARWREFSPVCVVDDMTTYLSPCQAGCGGVVNEGGLMVYKNCTCAPSGVAVAGACGERGCEAARGIQRMVYVLLLLFFVLAVQAHTALLLKSSDPRDKSVVLGVAGSVVAMTAFVLGHCVFSGINYSTCIWFDPNWCHLNSRVYPAIAGWTSAGMAFASSAICITTFICMKVRARRKVENTRL